MKYSIRLLTLFLGIVVGVNFSSVCSAGQTLREKHNVETLVAPLVIFNPNFGNGGGVAVTALFDMDPEQTDLQASSIGFTGLYSDRGSRGIGMMGEFYPNQRWRFKSGLGAFGVKSQLDIGLPAGRADFTVNVNALLIEAHYKIADKVYFGGKGVFSDIGYSADNIAGQQYLDLVDATDSTRGGAGVVLTYDSRDNRFFPYRGIFSEASAMFFPPALGNDEEYYALEGFVNGYRQYRPNHVIAARLSGRFTPEDTPYSGLSTLGQKSDLRGYVAGEHIANHLISAQVEYRWHFKEKWALVGFIGEAALFNSSDSIRDSLYTSGGAGIRYTMSEERRLNFRIDYAVGEGNSDGLYVGFSEAF